MLCGCGYCCCCCCAADISILFDSRRPHPSLMTAETTRQPRLPQLGQQVFNERLCWQGGSSGRPAPVGRASQRRSISIDLCRTTRCPTAQHRVALRLPTPRNDHNFLPSFVLSHRQSTRLWLHFISRKRRTDKTRATAMHSRAAISAESQR